MNNIFDIKRFWSYFMYDLRRARGRCGLSILLLGLTPVMFFVIYTIWTLALREPLEMLPSEMKFMAVFISATVVLYAFGSRIYGFVTEKRAGSDFLLLPASTLEKWISIVLMTCFVLPLVLFALLGISDALMSLIFPGLYGPRFFAGAVQDLNRMFFARIGEGLHLNVTLLTFLSWCENLLIFTLGALCFKRGKIAKTFLCLFCTGLVLSTLMLLFVGNAHLGYEWFEEHFATAEQIQRAIDSSLAIIYTLVIGGLLGGLYYRIRTLQH